MKIDNRLQKLRSKLIEKEIEAVLISQPENRYYLSGFSGSAGFLLITGQKAVLATDFRYLEQVKMEAPDYELFHITGDMAVWFPGFVAGLNLRRLGFEAEHVTFSFYQRLKDIITRQQPSLVLVPVNGLVESLRAVKEPEEIESISRAAEISDKAFEHIQDEIHAGMSEKEVAWQLEKFQRENGSQILPFDIIVASGPNAALPHAKASDRVINAGEPVVIDMGAGFSGYSSDMTRTICLGSPDATFKKVYDVVLGAQLTAIAIAREGMTGEQVDSLARKVIQESGYGEAFGHGLGHGIGLAPHESPRLGPNSTYLLAQDMVFTIEPGIYLPGWGGVRIEDTVMMDGGKVRVISKANKVGKE